VGGGEERRAGGELLVGVRDGVAVRAGAERVVDFGGLTVRGGVVERGGDTVRCGLRRSRLPDDGLVVRPDPTVPCAGRAGASPTRRSPAGRIPVGVEVVGRVVRRSAAGGVTVRPGGATSSPRRGVSLVFSGTRVSPTVRRASAPFGLRVVFGVPWGAATRPRPLMVGSVVAGAAPVGRRRASSDPGVDGADPGVLAAAVRRLVVVAAGLRPGDDAYAAVVAPVRRRAVTDGGCSP
jgi:hypothetical protein